MKKLTLRRWLLSVHILFVAAFIGVDVVFLFLSMTAANTRDADVLKACYTSLYLTAHKIAPIVSIGSMVSGIILSVFTQWGLFKFYWIMVKEFLTIISIALGVAGIRVWTEEAVAITSAEGLSALQNPVFIANSQKLFIGFSFVIISLAVMVIISYFKPWGKRKKSGKPIPS